MNILDKIKSGELLLRILTRTEYAGYFDKETEELSEEFIKLAEHGQKMQWKRIECGQPASGSFDIYGPAIGRKTDVEYDWESGTFNCNGYDIDICDVTHWMEIPAPPSE